MPEPAIAAAVLAGGRSSRMGGQAKALLPLAGKPLLQHVIDRILPQVQELYLSVELESPAFVRFGLPQLADPLPGSHGPLGGLLSALRMLKLDDKPEWLLLAPCDAPFVPCDLASRLYRQATTSGSAGAVVHQDGQLHPVFSLWNKSLLASLEQAVVEEKMAGFKQFLRVAPLARYDWPEPVPLSGLSPFFNINDQAALEQARLAVSQSAGN